METITHNHDIVHLLIDGETSLITSGIKNTRPEIEAILMKLLGMERIDLYMSHSPVSEGLKKEFWKMVEKRSSGVPLQHIIGKTEFFGLELLTPPGVFIPRPETEILLEAAISKLPPAAVVLDLCTGTGNIAIALARHVQHCKIFASDVSDKAIEIARENAIINKVEDRITFVSGDMFKPLTGADKFDVIISNPPYIRGDDLHSLPVEVKHDPTGALDGGEDGLDFYREIFKRSPDFLKPGGYLLLELGDDQAEDVKKIAGSQVFTGVEVVKDLNGIDRVLIWIKS